MRPARLTILLNLFIFQQVLAQAPVKIREHFDDVTLLQAVQTLKKHYRLKIAYDDVLLKQERVSANFQGVSLSAALKELLMETDLEHVIFDDKVIIKPIITEKDTKTHRGPWVLTGTVVDRQTGEPLPNALIRVLDTQKGAITNIDGIFTIANIVPKSIILEMQYLGYQSRVVEVTPGEGGRKAFALKRSVKILDDITIREDQVKTLKVNESVGKISIDPKEFSTLPSLGETDIFRTLQLLPGINATNETSAGLTIRGGENWQNLVRLDGFTIYHLDHFFGVFSAVNPDIVKDVQVHKGGYGVTYGGRVSGVVDIVGKNGNNTKPSFGFGANMISARAMVELPIAKKINLLVAGRRSYNDFLQSGLYKKLFAKARENDDQLYNLASDDILENPDNPSFYFYDVNGKLTYRPTEKDVLAVSYYQGRDRLDLDDDQEFLDDSNIFYQALKVNEQTNWGNRGLSLRWARQWNDRNYSNFRASYADFFSFHDFRYQTIIAEQDSLRSFLYTSRRNNKVSDITLQYDHEYVFESGPKVNFGVSSTFPEIFSQSFQDGEEVDRTMETGIILSAFAESELPLGDRFDLTAGIRWNANNSTNDTYWEPRLSWKYKLEDNLTLKAAWGRYYQFINQVSYEDPFSGNLDFWALSTQDGIPVLDATHLVGGLIWENDGWVVDIEAFSKNLRGLVEFNYIPFFLSGEVDVSETYLNGQGFVKGLDLFIQRKVGKYTGWIGYTISSSEQAIPNINEGNRFYNLNDQRHELKIVNMVDLGDWNFSANWIYGSGRPFMEPEVFYARNNDEVIVDFAVARGYDRSARLPAYHRLDVSVSRDFRLGSGKGSAGVSIFNVYGNTNIKERNLNLLPLQEAINTPITPELSYRDLEMLDFTPSLFINFYF